jgi:predicted MFS family arabinose efflux permease
VRVVRNAYREAFSGLPRPVWLLAAVTFINRSGTMVLPFLVLYLTEKRGFSAAAAGQALGIYGAGAMAGAYLGGCLCDRLAPRSVIALSLLGQGSGFLILGLLRSRPAILAMMLVLSLVGEAFRPASAAALVRASLPGEQSRAFSLNRLAVNLGMSFGPATGGFLASVSYLWLFVVDGGTCLLAALFLLAAFRGEGLLPEAAEGSGLAPGRSPWKDTAFLAFLPLMTLLGMVLFQLFSTYPLTLHGEYGFPESWIGLVLAINTLVISLVEMILVHRLRGRDPLRVAAVGSMLFCLGFALLPFGSSFAFVAATVLVWTCGEMLSLPFLSGWVGNRAGEKSVGSYMGLFSVSISIAFVLGPLAGTWIYQRFGGTPLWYGCGVVGLFLGTAFSILSAGPARRGAVADALPIRDG